MGIICYYPLLSSISVKVLSIQEQRVLFFFLFYLNSELLPSDRPAGKSSFCDVYLLGCIFKGTGDAAIIPTLAVLAEGRFPMAPCRAAMSAVCLHTKWLRALCCRAQRISSSFLPKDHHGIWMSTRNDNTVQSSAVVFPSFWHFFKFQSQLILSIT